MAYRLVQWQKKQGRHHLPWQNTQDPYRIWLAEIMLQQTRVATVVPYYHAFLSAFPTVAALAAAPLDAVLAQWAGLGYYARARHLHQAAGQIVQRQHWPTTVEDWQTIPGVGPSTAAAIVVFVFNRRATILDGNVKRILARVAGITTPLSQRTTQEQLWELAHRMVPRRNLRSYTQGLMDLGALICHRHDPHCTQCPLRADCVAYRCAQTATIPSVQPRPVAVLKHNTFGLLLYQRQILLQRRPAEGLWGGLWIPPILDTGEDNPALPVTPDIPATFSAIPHPPWTTHHVLTHFRFDMTAYLMSAQPQGPLQHPWQWLSVENERTACGVPRPIARWLAQIRAMPNLETTSTLHTSQCNQ